ncbi:hypothetical protein BDW59DRAFT_163176 [Aspergillus cavernicola]|uniref:BZIP domain-containing protein n=1 Tax=Aspergillus cavernicola TaxID=176166 RepID=A0ABR4I776_9EURO
MEKCGISEAAESRVGGEALGRERCKAEQCSPLDLQNHGDIMKESTEQRSFDVEQECLPESRIRRERKRLSDRLSQRTVRQRTKQRITELERQVEDLLASNPGHVLQEKILENEALRQENTELRRLIQRIGTLCMTNAVSITNAPFDSTKGCQKAHSPKMESVTTTEPGRTRDRPHPTPPEQQTSGLFTGSEGDASSTSLQLNEIFRANPGMHEDEDEAIPPVLLNDLFQSSSSDLTFDCPGTCPAECPRCNREPGWPQLLPLPCPKTSAIEKFEAWLQGVLLIYGELPREQLDSLLPASPCLAAVTCPGSCRYRLSRELADILRGKLPNTDFINITAAFWCLHRLLRYILIPDQEELGRTPSNMRPVATQSHFTVNWAHFLPWPHIRQALLVSPKDLLDTDFEQVISGGIYLSWPLGVDDAVTSISGEFASVSSREHFSCTCTSISLTENFKSHIEQAHNWCVKPIAPAFARRFPALEIVTR